eukprot:141910-Pleurochrysis_carterae.AAC.1
MEALPEGLAFKCKKLSEFSRNTFRVESNGSSQAGPSQVVSFNLPEGAILDIDSISLHMNVATTSATNASGQTLYAKLLSYSSSLISRVEILVNGQDILSGLSQYGAAYNLHNALYNTREKLHGIDAALENTFISDDDKVDSKTLVVRKLL